MKMMKSVLWMAAATLVSCSVWAAEGKGRSYVGGRFALEIEGVEAGWVRSVEGGGGSGEVVEEFLGSSLRKHLGQPKYDDFSLKADVGSKEIKSWIKASWDGKDARKDGSIIAADFNLRARQQADFFNALLTEVTFPACDGGSKDPAYLTVKFSPEVSTFKKAGGQPVRADGGNRGQKVWLPGNFRLDIDGLDCKRVSKIDSFTIKQTYQNSDVGTEREPMKEPTKIEFPNLKLRIPQADAETWVAWYEDFIVKGQNGSEHEKSGTLVFLAPNLRDALAQVSFSNIGLKRFTPFPGGDGDSIAHFEVELYVERMRLDVDPPTPQ